MPFVEHPAFRRPCIRCAAGLLAGRLATCTPRSTPRCGTVRLPTPSSLPSMERWWATPRQMIKTFSRLRLLAGELTAVSPEPGPRGRTQPRPVTPAPKPGLGSPSAFQLNTGTRKMTRERNISCTQPSRQPNAGGATDAHTPTPPAACDRNALSALWKLGSGHLTWLSALLPLRLPGAPAA